MKNHEVLQRAPEWRERLDGLLPEFSDETEVAIIGCGSVGSILAESLARAGIKRFVLVDPDHVEIQNLTRSTYLQRDVRRLKVHALKSRLLEIFPDLVVNSIASPVEKLANLKDLISDASLVVSAVDSHLASARINRVAYVIGRSTTKNKSTPIVIHVALYKGADGGEVITTIPGITACWHCSTGGVRDALAQSGANSVDRAVDYGSNRLKGEIALGADIHHCTTAATKIALSLLSLEDEASRLANFMGGALARGSNYLMLGMAPSNILFADVLRHAPAQYAYQSLWLNTASQSNCPFCGEEGDH